jgi:hypothetical protein
MKIGFYRSGGRSMMPCGKPVRAAETVPANVDAGPAACALRIGPGPGKTLFATFTAQRSQKMGFKDPGFLERKSAATDARKAALEKFRANANDSGAAERQTARQGVVAAREARAAERKAAKAAREIEAAAEAARAKELAEKAKLDAAAQAKRDAAEKAEREIAEAAARKAVRDAKYAARKARKK